MNYFNNECFGYQTSANWDETKSDISKSVISSSTIIFSSSEKKDKRKKNK